METRQLSQILHAAQADGHEPKLVRLKSDTTVSFAHAKDITVHPNGLLSFVQVKTKHYIDISDIAVVEIQIP